MTDEPFVPFLYGAQYCGFIFTLHLQDLLVLNHKASPLKAHLARFDIEMILTSTEWQQRQFTIRWSTLTKT